MISQSIVILDDNGSSLGVVIIKDDKPMLCDNRGTLLKEVSKKMTMKAIKEILVTLKLKEIVV